VSVLGDGAPSVRVIAARITGDAREDAAASGYQRRPPARRLAPPGHLGSPRSPLPTPHRWLAPRQTSRRAPLSRMASRTCAVPRLHTPRELRRRSRKRSWPPTAWITASCPVMAERTVEGTVTSPAATRKRGCRTVTASGLCAKCHLLTGGERAFEDASPAGAEHDDLDRPASRPAGRFSHHARTWCSARPVVLLGSSVAALAEPREPRHDLQAAAQPAAARDANPKPHHGGAEPDEPRAGRDERAVQLERFRQGDRLRPWSKGRGWPPRASARRARPGRRSCPRRSVAAAAAGGWNKTASRPGRAAASCR
jgi:hypothetical protein